MTGATTWVELMSQPDTWEKVLIRLDRKADIPNVSLEEFDEVVMIGSGTSYYLAMAAADWIRRRYALEVRAVPSCEVILDSFETRPKPGKKRLAIGFSRSGESSELLLAIKALRLAGNVILTVSCTAESSLSKLGHHKFNIPEGSESGLVMLRSFTSMLIAVQYLFGSEDDRKALHALPLAGRQILDSRVESLRKIVNRQALNRFVFLASGPSYPIAVEAGLKIQEMSISTSEAYHSLEYRHGPKATADRNTMVTLFALPDVKHGIALARDLKALNATLLVVGPGAQAYEEIADLTIPAFPGLSEEHAGPTSLLPLQVMAFEAAIKSGQDPDAPVNLSKVVTF